MKSQSGRGQSAASIGKNESFFRDHHGAYSEGVSNLDTYVHLRAAINQAISGIGLLLDVGNGGVFDYDPAQCGEVVALDLFLDQLPASYIPPPNARLKPGSALDIPDADGSYDGVLLVMLIHHLVGESPGESAANMRRAIAEAFRVLRQGGKLIVVESCVPSWFYAFERLVFPVAAPFINRISEHPATLQYTPRLIASTMESVAGRRVVVAPIPKGKWILQFGHKWPSALTPASPFLFTMTK